MTHDLLASDKTGVTGERTFYHLSLDITLSGIISNVSARAQFRDALASPLTSKEEILERQAVVADLGARPGMLAALVRLSEEFDAIKSSWNEYRRSKYTAEAQKKSPLVSAEERCSVSAVTLSELLYFVRDIKETLEKFRPSSPALRAVLDDARKVAGGERFDALISVCGELEHRARLAPIDLRVTLDELGRIRTAELVDHKYLKVPDPNAPQKRAWFRKQAQDDMKCEHVTPTKEDANELLPSPFVELANALDDISKQIIEQYSGFCRSLPFFAAASEYIAFLTGRGVGFVYPTFTDGEAEVTELYDIGLLASAEDAAKITPHTVRSKAGGIVVTGANGSGKTTLLRSLAAAQLLAQSGLPIPASSARLRVCTAIYTQFAEGERDAGDSDAGRFEQEVRELSLLVEKAPPGSLVVLNETFQSTSYSEGAEGLYHILRYFGRRGISYILATHIGQLHGMLRGQALCLRMNGSREPVPEE